MSASFEEQLGEQVPLGEWGTVSFVVPDFMDEIRDTVNDFMELLIGFLEVANLALEFAKAFLTAFLDPLTALIEAIIEEINALITDLSQIGIYITGDWALLGWPPEDLRGGYQAYERRMVARLTDRNDPTRPEVSSKTTVLGFFTYLSVAPSDIERLFNSVLGFIDLFGLSFFADTSKLPIPNLLEVYYGAETANVINFSSMIDTLTTFDGTPPQKARVTWEAVPASAKSPLNPFPVLGPSGFIVTVSVFEDGIPLRYSRPKGNTDKKDPKDKKTGGDQVQPREYGVVRDSNAQPVVLHGGAEMLAFTGSPFEYNTNIDIGSTDPVTEVFTEGTGLPKDGTAQVFGMLTPADNEIIPLEELGLATELGRPGDGRGKEFAFQRTFLIESDIAIIHWFAGEFSAVFDLADMPATGIMTGTDGLFRFTPNNQDGEGKATSESKATSYYVRAWSVGKEVAEATVVPQWDFTTDAAKQNQFTSGQPFLIGLKSGESSIGFPSTPRKITFAGAHTSAYLTALQTALMVLVLSRVDLPLLEELRTLKGDKTVDKYKDGKWAGQGFALLETTLEPSRFLLKSLFADIKEIEKAGLSPQAFRTTLYTRIKQFTLEMYERSGPNPISEKAVVEATVQLRAYTWRDVFDGIDVDVGEHFADHAESQGVNLETTLFEGLNPDNPMSALLEFGVAPNIFSMGAAFEEVEILFTIPGAIQGRPPMFSEWNGGEITVVVEESDPAKVTQLIESSIPSLRDFYEKWRQKDGTLLAPVGHAQAKQEIVDERRVTGSADLSPVFYAGLSGLRNLRRIKGSSKADTSIWQRTFFCRSFFRKAFIGTTEGGLLLQSAIALNTASAAFDRAPEDGEWIAIRLFDAFPMLEEFLAAIENWVRSINAAIKSIADTIIKYIEFVQAQIVELQQLIRRINSLITSLLSFSFALPSFSGVMMVSNGTDGLLGDFITAENKPSDSPQSYGAGVAIVVPFAPTFLLDLIFLGVNAPSTETLTIRPPPAIGVEELPEAALEAPSDEPDVL